MPLDLTQFKPVGAPAAAPAASAAPQPSAQAPVSAGGLDLSTFKPVSGTSSGTGASMAPGAPQPLPGTQTGVIPVIQPKAGESAVASGAKTAANVIPSAGNAVIGLGKSIWNGLKNITDIPAAAEEAYKASGGLVPFLKNEGKALYETVVPEGARDLVSAGGAAIAGNGDKAFSKLASAKNAIETDPVGQIAPFLLAGREVAYKVSPEAGAAFDEAISKTASPVTSAASKVSDAIGGATGPKSLGRFAVAKATGLDPETIKTIVDKPSEFSKSNQANLDRPTVAAEIKAALDARDESLSETGKAYEPIRSATAGVPAMISVEPDFLTKAVQDTTGTTIGKDGQIRSSGAATLRDPRDVTGMQNFYNRWQPYFEQGQMTPNEFLNMRSDLGQLSKFDREITKSDQLENASQGLYSKLNTAYRSKIPNLEDTDVTYSSLKTDLKTMRKGILDKNGELTDAGINKIANATNKGRSVFLKQIEEIQPGITERVRALKAVEDIENARGHKVGTYVRAAAEGGGAIAALTAGNIPVLAGIIATAILSSPDIAVPLIRAYGSSAALIEAVIGKLKAGAGAVNQLPNTGLRGLIPKTVNKAVPAK